MEHKGSLPYLQLWAFDLNPEHMNSVNATHPIPR